MATPQSQKSTVQGPAKAKTAANSLILSFAAVGILVGLNVISTRLFARADLTEDKIYKLSPVSVNVVKDLPDRMNVKLFVSGDLPPPLNQVGQYVGDLLDEYRVASGGKLSFERIDPLEGKDADEKAKKKEEITKYKVQKITLEKVSESKLEIGSENYLGIAFVYGDQIESLPQVTRSEGLEFEITGMIKRMVATKKKKIGLASSEGEMTQQQGLQLFTRIMQDYDTAPVTLDKPVGEDIDALFIIGPKQPFNEKAKFYIDQFLMKGKPVAMFVDGMKIEAPRGMQMPGQDQPKIGQANDVNLQDLLEKYGLKVRDDVIFDEQDAPGFVPVNGQMFLANYPTFVGVKDTGFTKDFELTKTIGALVFPFASSMELVGDLKDGKGAVKATAIARTTDHSWRNAGLFIFNPTVKLKKPDTDTDRGPFVLGYGLQGKFTSAYKDGAPGTQPGMSDPENDHLIKESPDNTRLIVIGCSGMLDDHQIPVQQVPIYVKNLQFAANSVDWLIHDDGLIALRAKGMSQRPFMVGAEARSNFWMWAIRGGVPVLLIAFGILLSFLRSSRRERATLANL